MTVSEVLALLDAERDERGMKNWESLRRLFLVSC